MAQPLIQRVARHRVGLTIFAVAAILTAASLRLMHIALRPAAIWSGLALMAVLLVLTLFNARKKVPCLPLLRAAAWLRFHSYAGWFSVLLFLLHIQFRVPNGQLEILLAALFVGVTVSGIAGLILSRTLPPRLTRHGEEVIFERIPALRAELRERVEKTVVNSIAETDSSTLADYYPTCLQNFFDRPRDWWWHVIGSNLPLHARLTRLADLDRYLNEKELAIAATLADCIRVKDNLDFNHACQGLLKGWLFVHIPLSYSLLLVAAVHGLLAWFFTHGAG